MVKPIWMPELELDDDKIIIVDAGHLSQVQFYVNCGLRKCEEIVMHKNFYRNS